MGLCALAGCLGLAAPSYGAEVTLYGAGSLKGAVSEILKNFTAQTGIAAKSDFGPSGMMRERIEKGEPVDVFTSADMGHPRKLAASGWADFVIRFTGNKLCAMAKPELGLTTDNFLAKALDPALKLGTSTPKSDPSGDYTFDMFTRAEKLKSGAAEALKAKALKLVGGPQAEPIPAGKSAVPYMFETGKADLFIAYCTTGKQAADAGITLTVVDLPAELSTTAEYGMVVAKSAGPEGQKLGLYLLSEPAQAVLAKWGFTPLGQ